MFLHQTKKHLLSKENDQKTKSLPTEWEKIFVNKVLLSNIYKELIQHNIKKPQNNFIKTWQRTTVDFFFKEDIQMANRDMKRSSSLTIKKI